jgi:hypothetical protein
MSNASRPFRGAARCTCSQRCYCGWCCGCGRALWHPVPRRCVLAAPEDFGRGAGSVARSLVQLREARTVPRPTRGRTGEPFPPRPTRAPSWDGRASMSRAIIPAHRSRRSGRSPRRRIATRGRDRSNKSLLARGRIGARWTPAADAGRPISARALRRQPARSRRSRRRGPDMPQHRAACGSVFAPVGADTWLMVLPGHDGRPVVSGRPRLWPQPGRRGRALSVWFRRARMPRRLICARVRRWPARREGSGRRSLRSSLPRVPLRVALEARLSQTRQGTELRPAAIAVTELPPVASPGAGRRGLCPGRLCRREVRHRLRRRTGARRSARSPVGRNRNQGRGGRLGRGAEGRRPARHRPTAAVLFRLGEGRGRIAADYRFRVAGDAEPRSGPRSRFLRVSRAARLHSAARLR